MGEFEDCGSLMSQSVLDAIAELSLIVETSYECGHLVHKVYVPEDEKVYEVRNFIEFSGLVVALRTLLKYKEK